VLPFNIIAHIKRDNIAAEYVGEKPNATADSTVP
jgi:hypothetical protein